MPREGKWGEQRATASEGEDEDGKLEEGKVTDGKVFELCFRFGPGP